MLRTSRSLLSLLLVALLWFQSLPQVWAAVSAGECVNGLSQAQIDQLYSIGVKESRIQEMCADSSLNPASLDAVLNSGVPESFIRRLFDNNQASSVINNWPGIMAGFATTGQLPAGITPYYPEEKAVFEMIGLTPAQLQFIPPKGLKEALDTYTKEQMNKAFDGAVGFAAGLAMSYLNLAVLAILSPLLLIACKSRVSVLTYVGVSMAYLIVEISLWSQYTKAINRITNLVEGAPEEIEKIQEDSKEAIEETRNVGTGTAGAVQRDCGPLVSSGASAQDIADCIAETGTSTDTSKAEESWKKVGEDVVNQVKMLEYARDSLDTIHTIIKTKAFNATITAGVG